MYIKRFQVENLWDRETYCLDFQGKDNKVKQWPVIDGFEPSQTLLLFKMLSLCLGAKCENVSFLAGEILERRYEKNKPVRFGAELYPDLDKKSYGSRIIQTGGDVSGSGIIHLFSEKAAFTDLQPLGNFAYGYYAKRGRSQQLKRDYTAVTRQRHTRFQTFFNNNFPAIPVNDWLYRQYRNAARYNSETARDLYNTVLTAVTGLLPGLRFSHWDESHTIFFTMDTGTYPISQLPAGYIAAIEFLVDFTRQLSESRLNGSHFNPTDGVLFIHQMENVFSLWDNPKAARILSDILPNMQFIITSGHKEITAFFKQMEEKTLPCPGYVDKVTKWVVTKPGKKSFTQYKNIFKRNRFPVFSPASGDTVVLIDVDSKIPNLALMKISRYYKGKGRNVILTRDSSIHRHSKQVFASSVFRNKTTRNKIEGLKRIHGENITIGGSGVNTFNQLPGEIESQMPDYSLYPGVDFAMGFLTRGCSHRCGFCLVPKKEGALRLVSTIDHIVPKGFKKLVLLDNNLLAYPGAGDILKEIGRRELQVNFNQTLDIKYLTPRNAGLLLNVDSRNYSFTKPMYYFSLNSSALIPVVEEKIKLLKGLKRRDITFICMYGYNTTLSDDVKRFSFLQELGVLPFVQEFQPVDDSLVPGVMNYFDTDPDALLSIYFRLNGRNFEGFLKWVSRKYVEEFGRLHMPLVELIFKYNNKPYKHRYIETMAGTKSI